MVGQRGIITPTFLLTGSLEKSLPMTTVVPLRIGVAVSAVTLPSASKVTLEPTGSDSLLDETSTFPSSQQDERASPRKPNVLSLKGYK